MGSIENRKEPLLKRLAERNESRILKNLSNNTRRAVDLRATEKAFLNTSPSSINMKTPLDPSKTITALTGSPIMSSEERAAKQIVALSTWVNTLMGVDSSEEMDLGATAAEATRRIQRMLRGEKKSEQQKPSSIYQKILENKDGGKVREACQKLLADSEMGQSIRAMLSKQQMEIRKELSVYNDLTLQTTLLRVFLSFHPKLLKVVLEALFNTEISAPLTRNISQIFIEKVFSNPVMLKNKKFAQGSGVPIITAAGRKALHDHFLEMSMKIMFLIEATYSHRLIPFITRIFTKSSQFKCLNEMFNDLTRELLTGSSRDFGKAFAAIGFKPTYQQSFVENHNYVAKGFEDYSDGLILAKLVETVGELPHGHILYQLRDPAGDRIRKIKNVETVLKEMIAIGISTEDVTAAAIVGGKKESIVSILWSIVGVRVAKEKRARYQRPPSEDLTTPKRKKRQSGVHDEMSTEVLMNLKSYGRELQIEIIDLDSIPEGCILEQIWLQYIPNAPQIDSYSGETSWEKIITFSELELQIPRGLHQNVTLFVKTFLERVELIRKHEDANMPRQSINSTLNDATFTVSRDSIDSFHGGAGFKAPITPLRGTFTRHTIAKHLNEVIEENIEEEEIEIEKEISENIEVEGGIKNEECQAGNQDSGEDFDRTPVANSFLREIKIESIDEISESSREVHESEITIQEDIVSTESTDMERTISPQSDSDSEGLEEGSEEIHDDVQNEMTDIEKQYSRDVSNDILLNVSSSEQIQNDSDDKTIRNGSMTTESLPEQTPDSNLESTETTVKSFSNDISTSEAKQEQPEDELTSETSEDVTPIPTPRKTIPADDAQPIPSERKIQIVEENDDSDFFQSFLNNQKEFIADNNLEVVIENDDPQSPSNTPELRRILRETRELKRKQLEIAKKLGAIERNALANQQCSSSYAPLDEEERSDAGHDEAMFIHNETSNLEEKLQDIESDTNESLELERKQTAAVVLQKTIRGFLARRRFYQEIQEWRERMIVYTQVLAVENQQFKRDETANSSLEMKLRHSALYGLTNDNLHVVLIAATIIDRITDLYPPLLEKFVVELNGIKLLYDILKVTDQGYAYKSILQPILNCLEKSFIRIPEDVTNEIIQPILPKLSPRLFLLMLKHSTTPNFFNPIIITLISIGRRFPTEERSGMKRWKNQIDQTMRKVTDGEGRKYLISLQTVCDHLL